MLEWSKIKFTRHVIRMSLRRLAPNRIPRTSPRADTVDCYTVELRSNDAPYQLLVSQLESGGVSGCFWGGEQYNIEGSLPNSELALSNIFSVHYIKTYSFQYESIIHFLFFETLRLPYIYIFINKINQFVFNIKPLIKRSRIDIIKWMLEKNIADGVEEFTEHRIMSDLYTDRWIYHPQQTQTRSHLRLILESLRHSGDLEERERRFRLTGRALITITEHEEFEQRHSDEVKHRKTIMWLTLALVLVGAAQAYFS